MEQVEEAYLHLHDWDWLRDSELVGLPEVQQRVNPRQIMPEAQVLRGMLFEVPGRSYRTSLQCRTR